MLERDSITLQQFVNANPQGLKPLVTRPFSARLKSYPDTMRRL